MWLFIIRIWVLYAKFPREDNFFIFCFPKFMGVGWGGLRLLNADQFVYNNIFNSFSVSMKCYFYLLLAIMTSDTSL